jgi:arylsulfatase A-like enzyme
MVVSWPARIERDAAPRSAFLHLVDVVPTILEAAKIPMPATVGARFGIDTFGIGEDSGQPVTSDYEAPFPFTGRIEKVVVQVK